MCGYLYYLVSRYDDVFFLYRMSLKTSQTFDNLSSI